MGLYKNKRVYYDWKFALTGKSGYLDIKKLHFAQLYKAYETALPHYVAYRLDPNSAHHTFESKFLSIVKWFKHCGLWDEERNEPNQKARPIFDKDWRERFG